MEFSAAQMENGTVGRRGRPTVAPEKRRKTLSVTLSPESLDLARECADRNGESISEYFENLVRSDSRARGLKTPANLIGDIMVEVHRAAPDARLLETSIGPTKLSGSVLTDKLSAIVSAVEGDGGVHVILVFTHIMHQPGRPPKNWTDPIDVTSWSPRRIAAEIIGGPKR